MSTQRNIFASIDLRGILDQYLTNTIIPFYGFDPTKPLTSEHKQRLLAIHLNDYNHSSPNSICRIGYHDSSILPSFTKLVSSKTSTIGWEIRPGDTRQEGGKTYLTNTYNLAIRANNGDNIRWWGHTLSPNINAQAIISNVTSIGDHTPPSEFTNYHRSNTSFYNAAQAVDTTNLAKGVNIETRQSYTLNCTINSSPKTITYNIELLLLTPPFMHSGNIVGIPFAKLVVDPTIIVEAAS